MKRIRRAGARKPRPISRRKTKAQSASLATVRKVLRIEADAIARLIGRVDRRFERAIDILYSCRGRVVVTGMGKSGLVAQKISATLSSTGTPRSFFIPPKPITGTWGGWFAATRWWRSPTAERPKRSSCFSKR